MRKFSNKITAIIGTATLAVGLIALPVLAGTTQQQGNGIVGQMQGFMQRTFSQGQQQTLMNSTAMQNLRNSAGMQNAMQTGDVKAMQDLMNSDENVKAQMGQENFDRMNQFMNNSGENIMTNGGHANGSRGTFSMMNGNGSLLLGGNMMGSDNVAQ